ncbi:hypothetical protein ATANTOWER_001527 [Ataeniobius toweri]|uniref:Uncharacterized protein n=1 Tax=Ataeniobius toweri TaxID=208326 RepID=A0ABU7AVD5_9TELE|nr:hypothetical protein [Ataeniobius toweri]
MLGHLLTGTRAVVAVRWVGRRSVYCTCTGAAGGLCSAWVNWGMVGAVGPRYMLPVRDCLPGDLDWSWCGVHCEYRARWCLLCCACGRRLHWHCTRPLPCHHSMLCCGRQDVASWRARLGRVDTSFVRGPGWQQESLGARNEWDHLLGLGSCCPSGVLVPGVWLLGVGPPGVPVLWGAFGCLWLRFPLCVSRVRGGRLNPCSWLMRQIYNTVNISQLMLSGMLSTSPRFLPPSVPKGFHQTYGVKLQFSLFPPGNQRWTQR